MIVGPDYQDTLGTISIPIPLSRDITFARISARGNLNINVELSASIIRRHEDENWELIIDAKAEGDFRSVVEAFGSQIFNRDFNLSKSISLICYFIQNSLDRILILSDDHNPILEIAVYKFLQIALNVSLATIKNLIMVAYKIIDYAKLLISYLIGAIKDFAYRVTEIIEISVRGAIMA